MLKMAPFFFFLQLLFCSNDIDGNKCLGETMSSLSCFTVGVRMPQLCQIGTRLDACHKPAGRSSYL